MGCREGIRSIAKLKHRSKGREVEQPHNVLKIESERTGLNASDVCSGSDQIYTKPGDLATVLPNLIWSQVESLGCCGNLSQVHRVVSWCSIRFKAPPKDPALISDNDAFLNQVQNEEAATLRHRPEVFR